MNAFFEAIAPFSHLSEQSKKAMASVLVKHTLPKGHVLIEQNTICDHIYFIEKGLTRTYYLKNGKDVTDWISPENTFACSILSFLTRQPDRRIIELLEPSILWALHYNDLEKLYSQYHDIENLGRHLVGFGLVQVQQRFDELHFETAANRYKTLLKNHPDYLKRIPLGILASYLGMTQETLSRARSKKK